jgi:Tfp pilus assembly protein PilE
VSVFLPPVPIPGDGSRRGFTAVELMVAITTALVVCAGAYSLAKTSLEAFQQEARMNAAQYNNVMGMNRLVTDIKRAGFQTSPDAATDAQVCVVPGATQSALLRAVNVTEGATGYGVGTGVGALLDYPVLPVEVTGLTNRRAPDRIRLSANYATAERFKLGAVDLAGDRISVQGRSASRSARLQGVSVRGRAVLLRDVPGGGPRPHRRRGEPLQVHRGGRLR